MKNYFVLTGDINGFTRVPAEKRENLIRQISDLIISWTSAEEARIFRGDSFQIVFEDGYEVLRRGLQLRCWLKSGNLIEKKIVLDARMAIGSGQIAYRGNSVLDSDGEAFHISGRAFDNLSADEFFKVVTPVHETNEHLNIICMLMEVVINSLTASQAEVILMALEKKTQQQMADELSIAQSAVNNRLKLAKWKEIEKTIHYISALIHIKK